MSEWLSPADLLLYVALPYAAVVLFLAGVWHRFRQHGSGIVTGSHQFLDPKGHHRASALLHYGLIGALLIHLFFILFPDIGLAWNSEPIRLYLAELLALTLGILALVGILLSMSRRRRPRLQAVTRPLDWVLLGTLLFQVLTGLAASIFHPWGTSWMAAASSPYLASLALLQPAPEFVGEAPFLLALHFGGAAILLILIPFTSLVHLLLIPRNLFRKRPSILVRWRR